MIFSRFVAYKAPLEMSSLRAFRIQKTKPVTSSPSTGSEAPSASSQELSQSQETSKDSQNGNSKHDESTEDVIRPPVTYKFYHFIKVKHVMLFLLLFYFF